MTSEQRQQASAAFWRDDQSTDDQLQAVLVISQQKKFRPKTVLSLAPDRKARHLAGLPTLPDTVAARILIAYHLADHRPMMGAFLDALGIAHEDGLIQDDDVTPDPAKVGPAATQLATQFPHEHVALYLNTLLCQDPVTWAGLQDVPERGESTVGADAVESAPHDAPGV